MIVKNKVPVLYLLNEVKHQLFAVTLIAVVAEALPRILEEGSLPTNIPITIATTLGIAISVLLSFKMSQSYDRWWEARQIWGAIVNDSRTLVLQLLLYVGPHNPAIRQIAHTQIAWCYALSKTLRRQDVLPALADLLPASAIARLQHQQNIPLKIVGFQMAAVGELFAAGKINDFSRVQLEETLSRLTTAMGKCERIKNTVFPSNYTLLLHGAIYLFVVFLGVSEPFHLNFFLEVVILLVVSAVFFSLEKAAYRLQAPFENRPTDTAMTSISRTIDINIRQLLDEQDLPAPIAPTGFYSM